MTDEKIRERAEELAQACGCGLAALHEPVALSQLEIAAYEALPPRAYRCGFEREPGGDLCTGLVHMPATEMQGRCDTCGGWLGRYAPGDEQRPVAPPLGKPSHDGAHCHASGRPHLGPCVDTLARRR